MIKRSLTITNGFILAITIVILLFSNYNLNIKPNIQINQAYQKVCSKENYDLTDYKEKCDKLNEIGKAVNLEFSFVYDELLHQTFGLFITIIIVFVFASVFRFHRLIHSGFIKYMLTREKYTDIFMKESLYSIVNIIFLFTTYFFIFLLIVYKTSETYTTFNYIEIFNTYLNTLLYLIFSTLVALFFIKKINNIVLYILITFLVIFSSFIGTELIIFISEMFFKNEIIYNFFSNLFVPLKESSKLYFIPNILINLLMMLLVIRAYKDKEGFIIESEKQSSFS